MTPATTQAEFNRLAMIRFPLILLVVFFHNDRGGDFTSLLSDAPFAEAVIGLLTQGFAKLRVPVFFLISGYVLFRSASVPALQWFWAKIKSRVRTLLVPLVLWNVVGLALLAVAQQVQVLSAFLNPATWGAPVTGLSTWQLFEAIVGTGSAQPFIYPLWFLRDLFVLVLLTPLFYWAIRVTWGWSTLFLALLWVTHLIPHFVAPDALIFFVIGCHVAIAHRSIFELDALGAAATLGWVILYLVWPEADQLKMILGVLSVLYLSDWLARRQRISAALNKAANYSFFIFAAHEPLLTLTRKAYIRIVQPVTGSEVLFGYFATVGGVIFALVVAFRAARRAIPRVLAVFTGGRA